MSHNPPILITGSHRSGTTWVGKVLSQVPRVLYISEPFAPNGILRKNQLFRLWYQYLDKPEYQVEYGLKHIIRGHYSLSQLCHFKNSLPATDFRNPQGIYTGKFDYRYFPARYQLFVDSLLRKIKYGHDFIPVMKDPIALFSAAWLHNHLQSRNVVLIRHPAAFVGSLKRLNWQFNFTNFLKQPDLMAKYLYPYEKQMRMASEDIITTGSILWNCIYHVINIFQRQYPQWYYLKHENLSFEPQHEFQQLFQYLNLPFEDSVRRYIALSTSTEANVGGKIHVLKRDSKANIKAWQSRLTAEEIHRIRTITEPVAASFYSSKDWE